MDDFSLFDWSSQFFLLIEFHCSFSMSYKMLPYNVYYNCILDRRMDRVRNEEVRGRARIERELASGADQRVFGHGKRIYKFRKARGVLMAEVSGGRPWLDRMVGVKVALGNREMTVESPGTYVIE